MFQKFFHKVTVFLIGVSIAFSLSCATLAQPGPTDVPIEHETIELISNDTTTNTINPSDSIRTELVRATNEYISQNFPKSKLTGEALVTACEKHDFDLCFALAQAEIESHLGTAGKAKKTNSPWNVHAWDSRSAQQMNKMGYGYSHPDQSIEPYIELVKSKYLGTKRTIYDLMKNYVTFSGKRYASNPKYEFALKAAYKRICARTNLNNLQQALRQCF